MKQRSACLMRRFAAALLAVTLLWVVAEPAEACPSCVENLPPGNEAAAEGEAAQPAAGGGLAAGFYYSILFMIGTPFLMVGGFGGWCYLEYRRRREPVTDGGMPPNDG